MATDELREFLDTEVIGLAFVWKMYRAMYAKPANVEKMNQISPTLFGLMQRAVIADLIRRVCAITDSPDSGANLVLRTVAESWSKSTGNPIPASVDAKMVAAETGVRTIRKHRNKLYAHLDVRTKRKKAANLPKLIGRHLDDAVRLIFEAMSAINHLVGGPNVAYEQTMLGNVEGEFEWMLSDVLRFKHLRALAADTKNSDADVRRLVARRSGRTDPPILESVVREEEVDG